MKPQYIEIDKNGSKWYYSDKELTTFHREDGPAYERVSGHKEWFINGRLHREDGPAIEGAHGHKSWWINDQRHRADGPACEYADGSTVWYINGKLLSEAEVNARKNKKPSCEGKVVEIDGKKYKLIPA